MKRFACLVLLLAGVGLAGACPLQVQSVVATQAIVAQPIVAVQTAAIVQPVQVGN